MKITFLGTGAADWNYDLHKDMDGFRRNSSLLIDDVLLIDPGAHVPNALDTFKKSPDSIKYIINTHTHNDHYCPQTVQALKATFFDVAIGETLTIGKYTVSALSANHPTSTGAKHFLINDGEKTLFYGLDGAWLTYSEVEAIKESLPDLAVLDATIGFITGDYRIFEHNNLNMILEIKATLAPYVKNWSISHMARTLHTSHTELALRMENEGIIAAYDGLELYI